MNKHEETVADAGVECIAPVHLAAGWGHHYPSGSHLVLLWSDCDDLHQSLLQKAFVDKLT
jgi:hypothetical protein